MTNIPKNFMYQSAILESPVSGNLDAFINERQKKRCRFWRDSANVDRMNLINSHSFDMEPQITLKEDEDKPWLPRLKDYTGSTGTSKLTSLRRRLPPSSQTRTRKIPKMEHPISEMTNNASNIHIESTDIKRMIEHSRKIGKMEVRTHEECENYIDCSITRSETLENIISSLQLQLPKESDLFNVLEKVKDHENLIVTGLINSIRMLTSQKSKNLQVGKSIKLLTLALRTICKYTDSATESPDHALFLDTCQKTENGSELPLNGILKALESIPADHNQELAKIIFALNKNVLNLKAQLKSSPAAEINKLTQLNETYRNENKQMRNDIRGLHEQIRELKNQAMLGREVRKNALENAFGNAYIRATEQRSHELERLKKEKDSVVLKLRAIKLNKDLFDGKVEVFDAETQTNSIEALLRTLSDEVDILEEN